VWYAFCLSLVCAVLISIWSKKEFQFKITLYRLIDLQTSIAVRKSVVRHRMNWHQKKNIFKKSIMFKCEINIGNMFPNEIMLKIFGNLDLKDLGRCTMVSKKFSELSRRSMLILLQNVTGLKDISRAMKVLHAHSILMQCVWKFYEIYKVWQKEKHFLDLRMYVELTKLESLQYSGHIKKFTRNIDSQFKKVSCFLKKNICFHCNIK
jgi:hypothetical protein